LDPATINGAANPPFGDAGHVQSAGEHDGSTREHGIRRLKPQDTVSADMHWTSGRRAQRLGVQRPKPVPDLYPTLP